MRKLWQVFVALVALLAAACGATDAVGPTVTAIAAGPPASASYAPSSSAPTTSSAIQPADRPGTQPGPTTSPPSDLITGFWVLGTLTRTGPGRCFGLTVDDGRQFALIGTGGGGLSVGDRIKARIMATEQPIDCGPGEAMILLELARAG